MQFIDGGVTAPQGFTASGILCGIKKGRTKNDTALIFSEKPCAAAGVFTQNRVKAECVKLTRRNIANGVMQAAIANSGNANACTGEQGAETHSGWQRPPLVHSELSRRMSLYVQPV